MLEPLIPVLAADVLNLLEREEAVQVVGEAGDLLQRLVQLFPAVFVTRLFLVRPLHPGGRAV